MVGESNSERKLGELPGANSPSTADAADDAVEQLVAYMDGELENREAVLVEQRLAADPEYRAELIKLQRAWDMLDQLPTGEVSESFTRSTVELVTQSLENEIAARRRQLLRFRLLWGGAFIAFGLVATAGGFLFLRWQQTAPTRRLVRDLPVIENSDRYRNAESIRFLERLEEEGLFESE